MSDQRRLTAKEISDKYDGFAKWYDVVEGVPDLLGIRKLRQQVLRQASGRVLEIAVGTGKNLRYYPRGCRIVAVDLSAEMLAIAQKRASRLQMKVWFLLADAEALPFSEDSFDTVVSSLSTCTFPDPVAALVEMARVCRTDGKILLLEHGRSNREWLGRWQDRHVDQFAKPLGCNWNREPLELAKEAHLKVSRARRNFFGLFYRIEAKPESNESRLRRLHRHHA
jgi:ubiquinone/menaquinone biosynthesis C-methylase UbiE